MALHEQPSEQPKLEAQSACIKHFQEDQFYTSLRSVPISRISVPQDFPPGDWEIIAEGMNHCLVWIYEDGKCKVAKIVQKGLLSQGNTTAASDEALDAPAQQVLAHFSAKFAQAIEGKQNFAEYLLAALDDELGKIQSSGVDLKTLSEQHLDEAVQGIILRLSQKQNPFGVPLQVLNQLFVELLTTMEGDAEHGPALMNIIQTKRAEAKAIMIRLVAESLGQYMQNALRKRIAESN